MGILKKLDDNDNAIDADGTQSTLVVTFLEKIKNGKL